MQSPAEPLRAKLAETAAALGLELNEHQTDTLLVYIALLQRWNSTYNLTSVRDPADMLTLHLADCLSIVAPLRRHMAQQPSHRVLDVGSGAGLPGVIIAALHPTVEVTCVDTVGKKAAFVQQAATELRLHNLRSVHARVEQMRGTSHDVITSRAFSALPEFVKLTRGQLADRGVWLAMKGKRPNDELAQLTSDIDVFHVEPLSVPGLDAARCLVWMKLRGGPIDKPDQLGVTPHQTP